VVDGTAGPESALLEERPAPRARRDDWVEALTSTGPRGQRALIDLHRLLLRAARHQVQTMRGQLSGAGAERIDEIAQAAADEALVAVLAKLPTFEGRSRFTTWAYKFAILQTATEVRRFAWQHREVLLDDGVERPGRESSPGSWAEASDLAAELRRAIRSDLTPHQRHVTVALLVDEVPIDVLAERLGTTRNALYKTLHDARVRLRAHLTASGHLSPPESQAGSG
jgi:RNA polymerase sigma-70 factor (ECF subfamily)